MTDLFEVVITAPDPEWLRAFNRQLVEDGLCASAHNFAPVRSIYRWCGEIYERTEGRVSLHTIRNRVIEIVTRAKKDHPTKCRASPHGRSSMAIRISLRGSLKRPRLTNEEWRLPDDG